MRHVQLQRGDRHIFQWKVQWDFIYTTQGDTEQALLLPRDLIPQTWWNWQPTQGRTCLEWPSDQLGLLREHVVNVTSASQLVIDVERILGSTQRRTESLVAQRPVPLDTSLLDPLYEEAWDERAEDEVLEHTSLLERSWSSEHYRRGFGSTEHGQCRGNTYEAWAAEVLMELCRKGSVFSQQGLKTLSD